MKRRKFIKDSAIVGAVSVSPSFVLAQSGMYSNERYRKVHRILTAGSTFVGTLPILRAFAGNHLDYVSPFVLFDEFGPVTISPNSDPLKVEAHPHAGVTPTTYFVSGSGHHKDSLDYDFQINTGEFMMFSSGKGAIHMEESGDELKENGKVKRGYIGIQLRPVDYNIAKSNGWEIPKGVYVARVFEDRPGAEAGIQHQFLQKTDQW